MSTALANYRSRVQEQPSCDDSWFVAALEQYRAGDEQARLRILGSCLRLALAVVESKHPTSGEEEFLRQVEEANSGLTKALTTFTGSSSAEFLRHAESVIVNRLSPSLGQK